MNVKNTSIIRRTALQYIFKNRGKSLVIILAVALCTFLFTALFTAGGGILKNLESQMQRQIGTTSMSSLKYLNEEEYNKIEADKKLKEVSRWIIVAEAINPELVKLRTEVHWSDPKSAEKGFCKPEAGHLPQTEDEAAFSSLVLQALGFKLDKTNYNSLLGQKVLLRLGIEDQTFEKEFKICGVFTGDRVSMSQIVLVSKAFQEKYVPTPVDSYYDMQSSDQGTKSIYGRIDAEIEFSIPLRIEQQLIMAVLRNGLPPDVYTGISKANGLSTMDGGTLLLVLFLLLTIFFSGYLIINNIYRINVYSDIRSYGLLKTIGMSGRQISKLVRFQALYLSIPGILLGTFAGTFVGIFLIPVITSILDGFSFSQINKNYFNIFIPLLSAGFSLVTVLASCHRPCRLASKVSPIEAVRYNEAQALSKNQKTKEGKITRYSNLSFASKNLSRDKKKVFWVILSLSLSLVILNSVYTMLHSFSEDKFVEHRIATDFSVFDASVDNPSLSFSSKNLSGVTDQFLADIKNQPGITELGNIRYENTYQQFTENDFAKIDSCLFEHPRFQSITCYGSPDLVKDIYREYKAADVKTYGLDEFVLANIPIITGQFDMQKFQSGNYILVNEYNMRLSENEGSIPFFIPGDKITVRNNQGQEKEYEVMATAELPYAFRLQQFSDLDIYYIFPTDEFQNFFGERNPMRCLFNVDDQYEDQIENWMAAYTEEVEPTLTYSSRKVFKQEFKSFTGMIVIVGGLLTGILALIGLLNLTNTMVTSILSRKLELAMLEAVGMTKKTQVQGMCIEGLLYAILTAITGFVLSTIFSILIVKPLGYGMSFYEWNFTLLPLVIVLPVMILITLLLPLIIYKLAMKTSVVERLRLSDV